jgi:hypothetical protein
MYSGEGTAHGPLLPLPPVLLADDGEDATVGNHDDVLAAELLLELTDETALDLVEALEQTEGHEDEHGGLATTEVDLPGAADEQLLEVTLKVGRVDLEIEQGLGDLQLELGRFGVLFLLDLSASRVHDAYAEGWKKMGHSFDGGGRIDLC